MRILDVPVEILLLSIAVGEAICIGFAGYHMVMLVRKAKGMMIRFLLGPFWILLPQEQPAEFHRVRFLKYAATSFALMILLFSISNIFDTKN